MTGRGLVVGEWLLGAFLILVAPACSGGAGANPDAGIDGKKLVRNLTAAEVRVLCDWVAAASGGYGHETKCDGGVTARGKADQQACVDSVKQTATCTATVADVQTCATRRAENPCDFSVTATLPACAALGTCG